MSVLPQKQNKLSVKEDKEGGQEPAEHPAADGEVRVQSLRICVTMETNLPNECKGQEFRKIKGKIWLKACLE